MRSASDVDNECGCYAARKMGVVCAHVVALGLEYLDPQAKPKSEEVEVAAGPRISSDWPQWTVEEVGGGEAGAVTGFVAVEY